MTSSADLIEALWTLLTRTLWSQDISAQVLKCRGQFTNLKGHLSDRSLVQKYLKLSTFKAFTDQYTIPSRRPLQIRPEQPTPSFQNCHTHLLKIPRILANSRPIWRPASVAQWAEVQCAPTGMVCRRGGVQSPGWPVDFVFGFQGHML